ncbi:MAG: RNA-binding S4 domain-containing protein [Calditrichaeota bacterium]|nr:MAG: RNA-binding S4 domain-containing protein [Calditrichota bacterium]
MGEDKQNPEATIRLDKWLKLSRIFKTRALAARACDDGKVKVDEQRAKPSKLIKVGDKITVKRRSKYQSYEVRMIPRKNVSKADAKLLYSERTPKISDEAKELMELLQEWDRQGKRKYKGRPTKKERRELEKIRGY